MAVFLVIAPCSLVEVYRRFRGACCLIALMLEAVSTSETSVNLYQTSRRNNPEDSYLHTRRRENLKSSSDAACFLGIRDRIAIKYYLYQLRTSV
jgi:hypothetical protein